MEKLILKKTTLFYIFISIALIVVAGFRPIGLDRDIFSYQYNILHYTDFTNLDFFNREPFFWLVAEFNKLLFNNQFRSFIVLYAILGVGVNVYAIKKLSISPLLSIFIYTLTYFILHEMTQIRVGVACGIVLLAIRDIYYRNAKSYLLKIILATMFHYSALVAVPFYFLNSKNMNYKFYFILPLIALVFSIFFTRYGLYILITFISNFPSVLTYKLNRYINFFQMGNGNGINIYNSYYTSLLFIYYFFIFNINRSHFKYDRLFVKILGWTLFILYFFSFLPVLSFRLAEITGMVIILLLPSLIMLFKQKHIMTAIVIAYTFLVFVNNIFLHHLLNIGAGVINL